MVYDAAIAGGGAAGLAAAITAAKRKLKVVVIEQNERVGKKLLATGNGRCNLASTLPTHNKYNTDAVEAAFAKVPLSRILGFFANLGLVVREECGRLYPYSNQASSVLNALRTGLENYGVKTLISSPISKISCNKNFVLDTASGIVEARNIVFATGSEAGGGKDSLNLLKDFGHKIVSARPALVPLLTDTTYIKGLRGIRAEVSATLISNGNAVKSVKEEVLFKDNGITGTAVFELSTALARHKGGSNYKVALDFAPEYTVKELSTLIKGKMGAEGLFHKEIVANISRYAAQRGITFAEGAKSFVLDIKGPSAFSLAQVVSGGLDINTFDLSTMQSKLCKGLYAAGEALDIDGDCGGFNLMWAWASGILAAESII